MKSSNFDLEIFESQEYVSKKSIEETTTNLVVSNQKVRLIDSRD